MNNIPDYKEYFTEYLTKNYPELANNIQFIEERNNLAKATYVNSIHKTNNFDLANELAMDALLSGYKFSKFYCIRNILLDDYQSIFSEDILEEYTNLFLPSCESVFSNYAISDSILSSPDYIDLKDALKHKIKQLMKDYWSFEL